MSNLMTKNQVIKQSRRKNVKRDFYMYCLLLPAIICVIIFSYIPLSGLLIAFKDYNVLDGFAESPWVGIKHFQNIFALPAFAKAVKNTFIYSGICLFGQFPFPIFLAICINEVKNSLARKTVQTISYLPHFLSWISVVGFAYSMFSVTGPYNDLMAKIFGEGYERKNILLESKNFIGVLFFSGLWKSTGWSSVLYLAAICGIDQSLYEAAEIDGCGRLKRIWYITLPCISTTAVLVLVLGVGGLVNTNFEQVYGFQNVYIQRETEVINTITYREGIQNGNYSAATALSATQGVISIILVLCANALSRKMAKISIW